MERVLARVLAARINLGFYVLESPDASHLRTSSFWRWLSAPDGSHTKSTTYRGLR